MTALKKNCAGLTYIRYTELTKHATAAKYIRSNCHTYLHMKISFLEGTTADIIHKIMPNMQAAHGSDIGIYSQVYIYIMFMVAICHVLGNKILPFNEKGISHVRKINKNHISSNTHVVSKQL